MKWYRKTQIKRDSKYKMHVQEVLARAFHRLANVLIKILGNNLYDIIKFANFLHKNKICISYKY